MTIPTHYELMLPILHIMKDQREYKISQLIERIIEQFNFTEEEKNERTPSGQSRIYDRVTWANSYMKHAKFIESTSRGIYRITQQGLDVLAENPKKTDLKYLYNFPAFVKWHDKRDDEDKSDATLDNYPSKLQNDTIVNKTPIELIEEGQFEFVRELEDELLEKVKSLSDQGFEYLVLKLFKKMGYGDNIKHTGKSGDHGIDGIIGQDKLGLEKIYTQAKKWQNVVGERELRDFVGALTATNTQKGIFITTSSFSQSAKEWIKNTHTNVILIDGNYLTKLLIEHNVGILISNTIELKKIDESYFEEF